jgi:hypothetical protein
MARLRFTNQIAAYARIVCPVDGSSSNGELCLNCLSHSRGQVQMADSSFWRDLADGFLKIRDSVRAGGASPYLWNAAEALADVRRGSANFCNF